MKPSVRFAYLHVLLLFVPLFSACTAALEQPRGELTNSGFRFPPPPEFDLQQITSFDSRGVETTILFRGEPCVEAWRQVYESEGKGWRHVYPVGRSSVVPGDVIDVHQAFLVVQPGEFQIEVSQIPRAECKDLGGLSNEERQALRTVYVSDWSAEIASQLEDLDPARCVLVIRGGGFLSREVGPPSNRHAHRTLPRLPKGTRHLVIQATLPEPRFTTYDYSNLATLPDLETLYFADRWISPRDINHLRALEYLSNLRALRSPISAKNLHAVAKARRLELLDLRSKEVLPDLTLLGGLRLLKGLHIGSTRVRGLEPLEHLPSLAVLEAPDTRVESLPPGGFPALRRLNLMGTPIKRLSVAAFKTTHPHCEILFDFTDVLRRTISGADRVVVSKSERGLKVRTLSELEGDDAVGFVSTFAVKNPKGLWGNACLDVYEVHVYRSKRLLATFSLHRLRPGGRVDGVRWAGWGGSAHLTPETREYLSSLIEDN